MPKLAIDRLDSAPKGAIEKNGRVTRGLSVRGLNAVIDALPEPMWTKDRSHRWVMVNAAFCDYMGRTRVELLGKTERDFLPDREAGIIWENDEAVFSTGQARVDEVVSIIHGEHPRVLQSHLSLLRDAADNDLLFGVIREADSPEALGTYGGRDANANSRRAPNERRKLDRLTSQQVRYAFSDPLTQLPNRRSFMNLFDTTKASRCDNAAVFVIGIDHIKLVNDRFGHCAGDGVIIEVADRLRASMRNIDILGRLDGDEFIVLAEDIDSMQAELIAETILAEIARPMKLNQQDYRVSVSIGVAMYPSHGNDAQDLVRNAGMALGWCKRRRRGGSEFYSDGASVAAERISTIEMKLPLALDQSMLSLHYQPIVSCDDRSVEGFEALVRWQDQELGDLMPSEFIPLAEHMGLIYQLGQSVLDQACAYIATVTDPKISVWVNVSGLQLTDETFPIFVAETLQKYNISGERLLLEITESVAMDADAAVWRVFDELTSIGVRLVIDDFGTGFSNLSRLKELPFAALKIDQEFIRDLPNSPQDCAIFRATLAIAKELNLKIVAEGVENAGQEDFVRRLSVDYMQGYKYGHPMPAAKFKKYCKA
ncbi:MAG: diguanylate cyclase (GGDEF)-like protein/PAS domain S-box-containing protein [Gammaproteobacteria bacterium]|jgi:diguanylate cyclase (GGDEF)-like protein/PAS domain S-box-containing protein